MTVTRADGSENATIPTAVNPSNESSDESLERQEKDPEEKRRRDEIYKQYQPSLEREDDMLNLKRNVSLFTGRRVFLKCYLRTNDLLERGYRVLRRTQAEILLLYTKKCSLQRQEVYYGLDFIKTVVQSFDHNPKYEGPRWRAMKILWFELIQKTEDLMVACVNDSSFWDDSLQWPPEIVAKCKMVVDDLTKANVLFRAIQDNLRAFCPYLTPQVFSNDVWMGFYLKPTLGASGLDFEGAKGFLLGLEKKPTGLMVGMYKFLPYLRHQCLVTFRGERFAVQRVFICDAPFDDAKYLTAIALNSCWDEEPSPKKKIAGLLEALENLQSKVHTQGFVDTVESIMEGLQHCQDFAGPGVSLSSLDPESQSIERAFQSSMLTLLQGTVTLEEITEKIGDGSSDTLTTTNVHALEDQWAKVSVATEYFVSDTKAFLYEMARLAKYYLPEWSPYD